MTSTEGKAGKGVDVRVVVIDYTNWKGDRSQRRIIPAGMVYGSSEFHPVPQWLLRAFDLDKQAERHFSMADIHSWSETAESASDDVHRVIGRAVLDAESQLLAAQQEIAALRRGEFICRKCGLRKDAEGVPEPNF